MKPLNLKKLGEFVEQRMKALRLTDRDVDRISKSEVSYGTVNKVVRVENKDIRLRTIRGLAIGLGVSVEHLIALVFNQNPQERDLLNSEEQELITNFRCLPFEMQTFMLQTIKTMRVQSEGADAVIEAEVLLDARHPTLLSAPLIASTQKKGVK